MYKLDSWAHILWAFVLTLKLGVTMMSLTLYGRLFCSGDYDSEEVDNQSSQDTKQPEVLLALPTVPINSLHFVISSNELMSENEKWSNGDGSASSPNYQGQNNLNVGMAPLPESIDFDPGLESHLENNEISL
jgi:hypothetical protein